MLYILWYMESEVQAPLFIMSIRGHRSKSVDNVMAMQAKVLYYSL